MDERSRMAYRKVVIEQVVHRWPVATRRNWRLNNESKYEQRDLVTIQAPGSHPHVGAHAPLTLALKEPSANASAEKRRKKDKTFCCREKAERLVYINAQSGRQMGAGHPHQHQAAQRIEFFNSTLHGFSFLSSPSKFRGHLVRSTDSTTRDQLTHIRMRRTAGRRL